LHVIYTNRRRRENEKEKQQHHQRSAMVESECEVKNKYRTPHTSQALYTPHTRHKEHTNVTEE
jgi:hypothetical protein